MVDQLGDEFKEFLAWRDAKRQAESEQDFEVPLFEKSADGTERSVTLPYSQGKKILGQWWPDLFGDTPGEGEGQGEGEGGKGKGQQGGPTPMQRFFGGGQGQQGGQRAG